MVQRFPFRPRLRGLALAAAATGAVAVALGIWRSTVALAVLGGLGLGLAALYLASPVWRYVVVIDDEALEVVRGDERRFRLPWRAVRRVLVSPATTTCFVDGGEPGKSLLVPGDGAPAPYDLADKPALYRAIVARVPADRIEEVASLDAREQRAPAITP